MEGQNQPLWTKDFTLLFIANLLLFSGFQMLLPTLPKYASSLGASDAAVGWLIGSSTIASLMIRPISGIILDKTGRKGILIAGLCILILVTITYGWLPTIGVIIAFRFLHGIGWGMASTASNTLATDKIPKQRFGEGVGFFSLSSSLSIALAPGIGLTVMAGYGFEPLVLLSAGLTAVVLLLSAFISSEKPLQVVKKTKLAPYERSSILPSAVMFFTSATYGSLISFLSLYAADRGIENISVFFTVYAVFLLLLRPLYGKLTDRFGFNVIVFPGFVLLVVAMLLLSRADTLPMFLITAAIYGMGFSALQSSLQTMAIVRAPKERRGAANATYFTGFDGGIGFGSVIGGIIASAFGYSQMYLFFSFFIVISGALYLFGFKKRKFKPTFTIMF